MSTELFTLIEFTRFIGIMLIIGVAAVFDKKTGEVPNKIWLYAIFGLTLTIIQNLAVNNVWFTLYQTGIILAIITFSYILQDRGFWGGADMKALTTIALSTPLFPAFTFFYLLPLPFFTQIISSLAVLLYFFSYCKVSKSDFKTQKVRYLPFLFFGLGFSLIIAVII